LRFSALRSARARRRPLGFPRFPAAVPQAGGPVDVRLLADIIYGDTNDKRASEEIVGGAITKYTFCYSFMAWV
jgi:hypothetical protein